MAPCKAVVLLASPDSINGDQRKTPDNGRRGSFGKESISVYGTSKPISLRDEQAEWRPSGVGSLLVGVGEAQELVLAPRAASEGDA